MILLSLEQQQHSLLGKGFKNLAEKEDMVFIILGAAALALFSNSYYNT
jgi:hypothetical protein